jgi:hypothetical protein
MCLERAGGLYQVNTENVQNESYTKAGIRTQK